MKIKTITCHNVYNYGASLQAYSLMCYLEKLGHDVEVIDYMPKYIRDSLSIWYMGKKWRKKNIFIRFAFYMYVVPIRLRQNKMRSKFKDFNARYLKLTSRYNTYKELKNNPPIADIYMCGSDQIWNTTINNGLDPAFYCDFAPTGKIRASYAASFSVSSLPEEHKQFIMSEIHKMDYISVREKSGLKILNGLGFDNGVLVVDPVFLQTKEHWLCMCNKPKYNNYILIYDQENNKTIKEIAINLAKKTGKAIIALRNLYPMSYADIQIKNSGPLDFIGLISCADLVITNSFHCSAFSIIMERDFFVVPRTFQKVNSRMSDLLEYVGIKDRLISSVDNINQVANIDYADVKEKLNILIDKSCKYIKTVLSKK